MNMFYRIVLTVAMLSFYSTSWADPVPLPCEPNCTVDPCSPPLGPKPGCPGYPSPGPVGESVEKAQVVDPCSYGCPKEGCPKCPTGGPIGAKAEHDKAGSDQEQQNGNRSQQGTSDTLRPAASTTCSACEASRRACFANCNASGPAVPGGQVECVKQCYKTFPCVPNRDCE